MKAEVDIRQARALVRDERLWPLVLERCFCDSSRKPFYHHFPKDDGSRLWLLGEETLREVAAWLEVVARAAELKGVVDGERVRVLKDQYGEAYPEAFKIAPYFARWHLPAADGLRLVATAMKAAPAELRPAEPLEGAEVPLDAIWRLLKFRFPEACELCCS